jgi:hypothetical protein
LPERHTSGNQLKGALVDFAQRNVFTDFWCGKGTNFAHYRDLKGFLVTQL